MQPIQHQDDWSAHRAIKYQASVTTVGKGRLGDAPLPKDVSPKSLRGEVLAHPSRYLTCDRYPNHLRVRFFLVNQIAHLRVFPFCRDRALDPRTNYQSLRSA